MIVIVRKNLVPSSEVRCMKSGAAGDRGPTGAAMLPGHETVTNTVGKIAGTGHVDMDDRARVSVFGAGRRLVSDSCFERHPVATTPHQHGGHDTIQSSSALISG